MTVTTASAQTATAIGIPKRRWSWPHYLALIGVPILVWDAWTVVAWLRDGPHQVTRYRTGGHNATWYTVQIYQALAIVVSVAVVVYVIRTCIRERRIFTFDVMFCLAGATIFWQDMGANWMQPVYLVNSDFVNLNNTCGHMPLVVNPDCGRAPDPILFFWLIGTFGILGLAILMGALVRYARRRWPGLSTVQLVLIVVGAGLLFDWAFEWPAIALHLWTYNAGPLALHFNAGMRYPLWECISGGIWFGTVILVRVFKDDRGQSFVERGLEQYSPRVRKGISMLAVYAFIQLVTLGPGTVPLVIAGAFQGTWPTMPADVVNGVCNAPGITGTRYGPCPGSPGFLLPGRHSLPGTSP